MIVLIFFVIDSKKMQISFIILAILENLALFCDKSAQKCQLEKRGIPLFFKKKSGNHTKKRKL